jgi:hypothetical protein
VAKVLLGIYREHIAQGDRRHSARRLSPSISL